MGAKPQLIVKGRKFDQVLEGARTVFMRDGFERASVPVLSRARGRGVKSHALRLFPHHSAPAFLEGAGKNAAAVPMPDPTSTTMPRWKPCCAGCGKDADFLLSDFK